jgi:hypothetical protein
VQPATAPPLAVRWLAVAAVLTIAVPAAAIAASTPLEPPPPKAVVQEFPGGNILTPVDDGVKAETTRVGNAQRLTWSSGGPWRADVFYRVYRSDGPGPDTECLQSSGVAWYCYLRMTPVATTREREFVDESAPPGATYRIGVGTNWLDDPELGDVFAFSPPVRAAP